jgi:hypothetical protein
MCPERLRKTTKKKNHERYTQHGCIVSLFRGKRARLFLITPQMFYGGHESARRRREGERGNLMDNERHYIYRQNIFRSEGSQQQPVRPSV